MTVPLRVLLVCGAVILVGNPLLLVVLLWGPWVASGVAVALLAVAMVETRKAEPVRNPYKLEGRR